LAEHLVGLAIGAHDVALAVTRVGVVTIR
jgi:hypothetical protein